MLHFQFTIENILYSFHYTWLSKYTLISVSSWKFGNYNRRRSRLSFNFTVGNVRKFTKIVLNWIFIKCILKLPNCNIIFIKFTIKLQNCKKKFQLLTTLNYSCYKFQNFQIQESEHSTLCNWKLRNCFLNLLKSDRIFWNSILILGNCENDGRNF